MGTGHHYLLKVIHKKEVVQLLKDYNDQGECGRSVIHNIYFFVGDCSDERLGFRLLSTLLCTGGKKEPNWLSYFYNNYPVSLTLLFLN